MSQILYQQDQFPTLQNRVYATYEEAINCPTGNIQLVQNTDTGLIVNKAFNSNLIKYDQHYDNEQANSQEFIDHLQKVKDLITKQIGEEDLIEVGCGKGTFLNMLLSEGIDIYGCDPTYEGNNSRIKKEFFKPGILNPAKGIILRHVLEHIPNPYEFLCQIRDANNGHGLIYIEVPCFDWISQKKAWFDIFYEHVNYFRKSDFLKLFGEVISIGNIFNNQYIYLVAELASLRKPKGPHAPCSQLQHDFSLIMQKKIIPEQQITVWGAASKGVIYTMIHERMGARVTNIIDINPKKQGKYIPITGVKIISPTDAMAVLPEGAPIHVMNSNYLKEIKRMSNNKFNYIGID